MATVSSPVPQYRHPNHPQHQYGVVSVTGTATVETGLGHNNFLVQLCIKGGLTALADGCSLAWDYGSKAGTFVITVTKQDAAFGDLILATVAKSVVFEVLAGSAGGLY